jgi:hypothetical protein
VLTISSSRLAAGTLNSLFGGKFPTAGNSAAGKVPSVKRLRPDCTRALASDTSICNTASTGKLRQISKSFLAGNVVVPSREPSTEQLMATSTSISVATKCTWLPVDVIKTFAKIGVLERLSTTLLTDCKAGRRVSLVTVIFIYSYTLLMVIRAGLSLEVSFFCLLIKTLLIIFELKKLWITIFGAPPFSRFCLGFSKS